MDDGPGQREAALGVVVQQDGCQGAVGRRAGAAAWGTVLCQSGQCMWVMWAKLGTCRQPQWPGVLEAVHPAVMSMQAAKTHIGKQ